MVSKPHPPAPQPPASHRKGSAPRDLASRLARIEGQVRGVARMVDEGRWCPDILIQLSAVEAALSGVKERLLASHLEHCVTRILESGDASEKRAAVAEVLDALRQAR